MRSYVTAAGVCREEGTSVKCLWLGASLLDVARQQFWQPTIFQRIATSHAHLGSVHCNTAGFATLL